MIYTGIVDSELTPIKVGDYMASETEHSVGQAFYDKRGLILSYGDTFDDLRDVGNKYHIVSENYANELYNFRIERLKTED